jgi:hypothetical protein
MCFYSIARLTQGRSFLSLVLVYRRHTVMSIFLLLRLNGVRFTEVSTNKRRLSMMVCYTKPSVLGGYCTYRQV